MKKSSGKIEEIDTHIEFSRPCCGTLISKSDKYCRKCGVNLAESSTPPSEELPQELYERKLSLINRFYKLLTAPSEAMRDIALAPDYGGVIVVIVLQIVLTSVAVVIVMQKIRFSGPYAAEIGGLVSGVLAFAMFVAVIPLLIKWLVKSLIVKYACDSESGWDFKTAASITGYAYVVTLVISIPGIFIAWFLLPTFHLNTTGLDSTAMTQAFNDYEAQLSWLKFGYTLPFSLLGLIWKSYLGGLGARFGTKEKCSLSRGLVVFFVLGLIGLLFSFVIT